MSASHSQSKQATTTTQISDSYNSTYNKVFNLSDVGNISESGNISIGLGGDNASMNVFPYILGALGIMALVIFFK